MKNSVKYYLAAYNFTAFVFWAAYLGVFVGCGCRLTQTGLLLLSIAQGMAVLEILHAALKWVKSPIGSTIAQVSSRLLVLLVINLLPVAGNTLCLDEPWPNETVVGLLLISFAWSITELVRYSFYFLSLFKIEWRPLLWMRYTFFIVLYPLGVTGEWLILIYPILKNGWSFNLTTAGLILLFLTYAYYFPVLYGYMWKQRKAKL